MKKNISRVLKVVIVSLAMLVMTCVPVFAAESISESQAKEIALKKAGLKEEEVIFLKVELDKGSDEEDSQESEEDEAAAGKYEIAFYHDGTEYEFEIDAESGKILKKSKDTEFFLNPGALPSSLP